MDKNFIHIDDLVRQRMSDAEEKERPAAWLHMRDLLDKEMPSGIVPRIGFNWRRMFSYLGVFLLLASVSVGGYEMYHAQKSFGSAGGPSATAPHKSAHHNTVAASGNTIDAAPATTLPVTVDASIAPAVAVTPLHVATGSATAGNKAQEGNAQGADKLNSTTTIAAHNTQVSATTAPARTVAHPVTVQSVTTNGNVNSNNNAATNTHIAKLKSDNTITTTPAAANTWAASSVAVNGMPKTPSVGMNTGDNAIDNTTTEAEVTANKSAGNNTPRSNHNNNTPQHLAATSLVAKGNNVYGSAVPLKKVENTVVAPKRKDSIRKMELLQHVTVDKNTHETLYRADTVAVGYLVFDVPQPKQAQQEPVAPVTTTTTEPSRRERKKLLALNKKNAATASQPAVTTPVVAKNVTAPVSKAPIAAAAPAPSSYTRSANFIGPVLPRENVYASATPKVEGHKITKSEVYEERMKDILNQVKFNMGHAAFYPGLIAGLNSSFLSGNTLMGFQFGIMGMLAFDEHWSILAELKYLQRSNNGLSVHDDYATGVNFENIGTTGNPNYHITGVNNQHYFNYSTLSTLEMPFMLRYSFSKLSLQGGFNMLYNFAINVEEKKIATPIDENSTTNTKSFGPSAARVKAEDFDKPIMGAGYTFGVGYQVTPAVGFDLRMTTLFWDNAKNPGARVISNTLYNVPGMQFNITYRFNADKKK